MVKRGRYKLIEALAKTAETRPSFSKVSKSFNPDARLTPPEKDAVQRSENQKEQSDFQHYDPDRRIEATQGEQEKTIAHYDPDKRVEQQKKNTERVENTNKDEYTDNNEKENREPIKNKQDGLRREKEVEDELREKYPEKEGYKVESEMYLRDKNGNIVRDPETGEARRIDFVVTKDGKVVDSVEVTSKTADKTGQTAKEQRIRENGGNYIKDSEGNLIEIPKDVNTRIERKD